MFPMTDVEEDQVLLNLPGPDLQEDLQESSGQHSNGFIPTQSGTMSDYDCWSCEYDWEVSSRWSKPRETVLCVLFDGGTQCKFSSIRITLVCGNDVASKLVKAWDIIPQPSSLSVVSRIPSAAQDMSVTQNDTSLPVCDIVFAANRHSAGPQSTSRVTKLCGELVLSKASSRVASNNILFQFERSLTAITQSVSVSFTSKNVLYTTITRSALSHFSSNCSAAVGRVVRLLPLAAMGKRRTISLPTDVLLLVFEQLRVPMTYRNWRKDILSSALVCREWTCALDMLLADFRSRYNQQGHPPEIVSLANGLLACPNLALGIKHLSVHYLEKHPSWDPYPELPPGNSSPMFITKLQLQQSGLRRSQFGEAFLSILRSARNVQTLHLDPGKNLAIPPDDLVDALRRLNKIEVFKGKCPLHMAKLVSCIVAWPSLKHLTITRVLPPSNHALPPFPPTCCLTEITLVDIPITDDELTCIVSASASTLEHLTLNHISHLTNAGLAATLNVVGTSLVSLCLSDALTKEPGEEHALDIAIARMARLTELQIVTGIASKRMLERRAEAFSQQTMPALTEVHLLLMIGGPGGDLVEAANRDWPGWEIDRLWLHL